MTVEIRIGDVMERLLDIPDESIDCVVTSPPYWSLRDYGVAGQIGLESTIGEHIAVIVAVCEELRRVLTPTGTFWLNYGDCYASGGNGGHRASAKFHGHRHRRGDRTGARKTPTDGLKNKDLCMMPARIALALQSNGWYLRSEIVWHKPNSMPESVSDRPTSAHEKIFLLTKSARYFFDADAVKVPASPDTHPRYARGRSTNHKWSDGGPGDQSIAKSFDHIRKPGVHPKSAQPGIGIKSNQSFNAALKDIVPERNIRNVWTIPNKGYPGAHFATFPPDLIEPCIKAGCPSGGVVLDPFGGSGTTGLVADRLERNAILIELNPEYAELARRRIADDGGLFSNVVRS